MRGREPRSSLRTVCSRKGGRCADGTILSARKLDTRSTWKEPKSCSTAKGRRKKRSDIFLNKLSDGSESGGAITERGKGGAISDSRNHSRKVALGEGIREAFLHQRKR